MAGIEVDFSTIEKKMLVEEAEKRETTLTKLVRKTLLKEIREEIKLRHKPTEETKKGSVFCIECMYDPKTCGEDVKRCLEEAELYFS